MYLGQGWATLQGRATTVMACAGVEPHCELYWVAYSSQIAHAWHSYLVWWDGMEHLLSGTSISLKTCWRNISKKNVLFIATHTGQAFHLMTLFCVCRQDWSGLDQSVWTVEEIKKSWNQLQELRMREKIEEIDCHNERTTSEIWTLHLERKEGKDSYCRMKISSPLLSFSVKN